MTENQPQTWPAWKRFPLLFLFSYVAIYSVDLLANVISFIAFLFAAPPWLQIPFTAPLWIHIVPWIGQHFLHLGPVKVSLFGSGDTLYDWLQLLCEAVLALIAAAIWTVRKPTRHSALRFHLYLRVAVRALLAAQMFMYGLDKVFPLQFREMTVQRMMQPMAAKTPMGVLWDFMAASTAYTIFTGLVEVLGGALLLVPAWTTLGALITAAAMTNIVALNLFYDIPVKRGSSHLLLLALFLLAPALPRLINFFLLNRTVPAEVTAPLSPRRHLNQAALWLPVLLSTIVILAGCTSGFKTLRQRHEAHLRRSTFYGAWQIDTFTLADPSKPIFTEKLKQDMSIDDHAATWLRIFFDGKKSAEIELGDGQLDHVEMEETANLLTLTDSGDPAWTCLLKPRPTGPGLLQLEGTINGTPAQLNLHRLDETQFKLTKRTFHWVNEW